MTAIESPWEPVILTKEELDTALLLDTGNAPCSLCCFYRNDFHGGCSQTPEFNKYRNIKRSWDACYTNINGECIPHPYGSEIVWRFKNENSVL